MIINNVLNFLLRKESRYIAINTFLNKKDYHQKSTYTELDRYPDLFAICQEYFKEKQGVRVLSFGCSSGEEIFTLKKVLSYGFMMGIDINEFVLKNARQINIDDKIVFANFSSEVFEKETGFDLILCCAVFQDVRNRTNFDNSRTKYLFKDFEESVLNLDGKLKPKGLILFDHCDFSFEDVSVRGKYIPLNVEGNENFRNRPFYNSMNMKVSDSHSNTRVYMKL